MKVEELSAKLDAKETNLKVGFPFDFTLASFHLFLSEWVGYKICCFGSEEPRTFNKNCKFPNISNLNVLWSNTILSNIDRTRTSFFEHRTNSNVFICWWSNSNTLFLASNDRTSNFEPNRAFTTLTKSLIRTLNELERVHLMVIELKHPIFGFEQTNIEHWT